jgi:hypothetical protein
LADVRDEVVHAWKLQKAAELALKHAEELATRAQDSGLPFTEAFADDDLPVTTTDPFSWLTFGDISPITRQIFFRMSEPEGIAAAGPAFMRKVFALAPGEVGAVLNHDRSIAYVIRVVEHLETPQQLQRGFLREANNWFGLESMQGFHMQEASGALINDIEASTGLEWVRTPDEVERE